MTTSNLATNNIDLSILSLISGSDLLGKIIIFILVLASIWSWTIFLSKLMQYARLKKKIRNFEQKFRAATKIDELYEQAQNLTSNPLANIFAESLAETKKGNIRSEQKSDMLKLSLKERVNQVIINSKNNELDKIEKNLNFLAIIGSTAPFIGLFGTVWGIMHSFQSIAVSKNTSLAVVAPGIAEALLATAIGLFAAIPAVIFYNYLSSQSFLLENKLDNFITKLNSVLARALEENKI